MIGLCVAPQEGKRTREQVRRTTDAVRQGVQRAQETARRVAPTVQSAAQSVGEVVGSVRSRLQHDADEEALISVNGGNRPGT